MIIKNHQNQKGDIIKKKGFYTTLFATILGFLCIYLFSVLDIQLKESAQRVEVEKYNIYKTLEVLVIIIFGILIEYKKLFSIFKNGVFVNIYYLITGVASIVLLVLPYEFIARLGIAYTYSIKGTISLVLII